MSVPHDERGGNVISEMYLHLQYPRTDVLGKDLFWSLLAGDRLFNGKVDTEHSRFTPVSNVATAAANEHPAVGARKVILPPQRVFCRAMRT